MRVFIGNAAAFMLVLVLASHADAVEIAVEPSVTFLDSTTAVVDGFTLRGAAVGDVVELGFYVENRDADVISTLFTSVIYDPTALDFLSGAAGPILEQPLVGGFGSTSLYPLRAPEPVAGSPPGTLLGLTHSTGPGSPGTSAVGPDLAFTIAFEILDLARPIIIQQAFETAAIVNDINYCGIGATPQGCDVFSADIFAFQSFTIIPEPTTAILMGLGLLGLASRRRWEGGVRGRGQPLERMRRARAARGNAFLTWPNPPGAQSDRAAGQLPVDRPTPRSASWRGPRPEGEVMRRIVFALSLALATPTLASDGVLEINQTCAVETGCFPGDTPGLPVTISASGSYRLTSNLVVPDENTSGIRIESDDVSIDLNHFSITRAACVGATEDCTPASGVGNGVEDPLNGRGLSIRNGTISGMGSAGILAGAESEMHGIRSRWNRRWGITAFSGSSVRENVVYENGEDGIIAGMGSTVLGNSAYRNGRDGIVVDVGSVVSENAASMNGRHGIRGNPGVSFLGNAAAGNGADGIHAVNDATITDNTAYGNSGNGIFSGSGSTVHRNTAASNGGFGLHLFSGVGYGANTVKTRVGSAGTVYFGVDAGGNVCNGILKCP